MSEGKIQGDALLERVRSDFIGLNTSYRTARGDVVRRVYLDSAATTLMLGCASEVAREFLAHYANTHSRIHFSARAATDCYAFAHERVLSFVGADPERYVCIFAGSGSTGALNRAAHYLGAHRRQASTVLVSLMEHHSNDLPHRRLGSVRHVPLTGRAPALGPVDVDAFASLLREEPVRYAAVTMVSNVTGVMNDVPRMISLARAEGVPTLVDASQAIAHMPVRMDALGEPEALVFSGHKIYAPGSPGVLVIRRDLVESAEPAELGGGMVDRVTKERFAVSSQLPAREEAGTPNIVGAVVLGAVLEVLDRIGMDRIAAHERSLTAYLLERLSSVPQLRIYGDPDLHRCPRAGVVTFNVSGLDHGFVAAVLNDYYNVAVRNECFCAQPYVRALLLPELWTLDVSDDLAQAERDIDRRRGMVRASLGIYSTREDVDALVTALSELQGSVARYREEYRVGGNGVYHNPRLSLPSAFHIPSTLDRLLGEPTG